MPTRLIRDGILDSPQVNALSEEAELFYRRLMSIVDDNGRFEDRPDLIRVKCFPLKLDDWPVERVEKCLSEASACQTDDGQMTVKCQPLVSRYSVNGKRYLQINNFRQRVRTEKYPAPQNDGQMTVNGRSDARLGVGVGVGVGDTPYSPPPEALPFDQGLPDDAFEQLERAYPVNAGKGSSVARRAWESEMGQENWEPKAWRKMMAEAAAMKAGEQAFQPSFHRWLEQGRWREDWAKNVQERQRKEADIHIEPIDYSKEII